MLPFLSMLRLYLLSPLTWWAFAFGLVVGSFLNVCIYRVPRKTFFKKARSHCPQCDALIPWWGNIPVLSWVLLRGRARCCGAKISVQYPLVELATGFIFVALYWVFPFFGRMSSGYLMDPAELIRFTHAVIFSSLLLVCSVIDMQHRIIPDVISLPMIAVSPLVALTHPDLTLTSSLLGILIGAGVFYALAWFYYLLRKEAGLGMGDVKLLAAIGGWLGYQALVPTIFLGSISGAVYGIGAIIITKNVHMKTAIPFGPFLALGAFTYLLAGGRVWEWFLW